VIKLRETWLARLAMRIGRRFWLRRVSAVLGQAYGKGLIDSWTLHELDARLKYNPDRDWPERPVRRQPRIEA
jgi:hypothetical protein